MKKFLALLLSILLIFAVSAVAFADFGDFAGDSDWDFGSDWGGDSDWGGSSDWGGDSGWGSSEWGSSGGTVFVPIGGSSGISSGTSSGGISLFEILIIVAVIAIAIFLFSRKQAAGQQNQPVHIPSAKPAAPMKNDLAALKAKDPAFSEEKFLSDASNLYVQLQNCWTARDITALQPRLTSALYAQSERQLDAYKQRRQTNHVERPNVISKSIVGCTSDSVNDILTVRLTSRIVDYTTDDETGKVLSGSPDRELFMTYDWTFIRSLDKKTDEGSAMDDTHCPNCGAPINLNQSAVCEYCGSVLESNRYDWVHSEIHGVSQRSAN